MRRICAAALLTALVVIGCGKATTQPPPSSGFSDAEMERLANLTEEQIDLGHVALLLATEAFPGLEVKRYEKQLDRLAAEIRQFTKMMRSRTADAAKPDYLIRAMNTYLYKRLGFHYDQDDLNALQLKNRYLNGVLDTKAGSCTTLPLLYLALAQRLGYPVYPVSAPQHLFCRFRLPDGTEQNIEATAGGWSPDEDYITQLEIPAQGLKSGAYMETMTYRQLLGDLIAENGSYWARQRDFIRAIKYYTLALKLNPKAAEVWRMQGYAYRQFANEYLMMEADLPQVSEPTVEATRGFYMVRFLRYQHEATKALATAKELGVAPPAQANYWVRQRELAQAARQRVVTTGGLNDKDK